MRPVRILPLLSVACLALAACGYSTRFSLPEQYSSIGIEVFGNDTREPDVELSFHESLVRVTRTLVDRPLVAPDRARVVMRGRVLDYRRRSGIRNKENVLQETGLTIRVVGELYDAALGEKVAGPVTVSTQIGYTVDTKTPNEAEARSRALDNLAELLVLDLVSHTGRPRGGDEGGG